MFRLGGLCQLLTANGISQRNYEPLQYHYLNKHFYNYMISDAAT